MDHNLLGAPSFPLAERMRGTTIEDMSSNSNPRLSDLPERSLSFSTARRRVRIDDNPEEVEQVYLTIEGTAAGYLWLAKHLERMAVSATSHDMANSNILAPWDLENRPVGLEGWDSLDFICRENPSGS